MSNSVDNPVGFGNSACAENPSNATSVEFGSAAEGNQKSPQQQQQMPGPQFYSTMDRNPPRTPAEWRARQLEQQQHQQFQQ